ncbi:hypothetical protein G1H11_15465 [Phytoactinopolyspora alkaliphila]|uniref:Uncharacterized protein n=1 Tax=Phytoactinopolyspora alkaliphila TaxID=1783498 RepID=A0A6N9YPD8_9ACTN|nr:hypothetical protein [Phytoactinopolyspora alkaliphila]NED96708.1 hypothetical protein [Phytoactinopolyspora alkaliphila]
MGVGYRSYLNVAEGEPLVETVVRHLTLWTEAKGIDASTLEPGKHLLKENDVISVLHEPHGDGRLFRWRREHPQPQTTTTMWRTTVTAAEYPGHAGWLWTEIELSEASRVNPYGFQSFMSVPSFQRAVMGELTCYDGRTPASVEPTWIQPSGLPDLMDYLADESRRGAVLVASHTVRPLAELYTWASRVTWELAGLGVIYLLDAAAEREFTEMLGDRHAVPPGTVRTYSPGVDLDAPMDSHRHRTLSRERIDDSQVRRLAQILGFAQRHRVAELPLTQDVADIAEFLDARAAELVGRPVRPGIRLVHPVDDDGTSVGVPEQREFTAVGTGGLTPASDVTLASSRLLSLASAAWSERAASAEELRLENARLHHEREVLAAMVRTYQRFEASILGTVQGLGVEMAALRASLDDEPADGRQHLNGL